jgi:hypothetical protein
MLNYNSGASSYASTGGTKIVILAMYVYLLGDGGYLSIMKNNLLPPRILYGQSLNVSTWRDLNARPQRI